MKIVHDVVGCFSQIAHSKDDTDGDNRQGDSLSHFNHSLQKKTGISIDMLLDHCRPRVLFALSGQHRK